MAGIRFKNVFKQYQGNIVAVKDFNLDISDKEFVVFVGPSGCGKSTTLRMIAGLESISSGELYIGDKLINNVEPKDRDIAMVFQNYALYPHMTVYDNMAFGLKQRKIPKKDIDKKIKDTSELLNISEYLGRKPKSLSGGQRQRVALGRAIVREPAVFLLDEPLSNLDAKLRTAMRMVIIKLHKRLNTTFVYVTHDQVEAMTMADKIVVMNNGVIQQVATPAELYNHPCNEFVASFIGSPQINLLNTKLLKKDDKYFIQLNSKLIEINACHGLKDYEDKDIILGVRPEHIYIADDEQADAIEAKVELVEATGTDTFIYLYIDKIPFTAKLSSERTLSNSKVYIKFNKNNFHMFDKITKESILK